MCYSAVVEQNLDLLARQAKAQVDVERFGVLFRRRADGEELKIAKALEANFLAPRTADEKRIAADIQAFQQTQAEKWEAELFRQKKRLADAERSLKSRVTKKAEADRRIAGDKIEWLLGKLKAMKRTEPKSGDERIFPFWYAPVVVEENGTRWIRPMRYHLRAHGKPAGTDRRYPGLYNARRDNLEGYWKNLFGRHHAVCLVKSFYENVALHDFENRDLRPGETPQNLVLHFNPTARDGGSAEREAVPSGTNAGAGFRPRPAHAMFVACLWDRWQKAGEPDLESFAAITDEPPPEVAATGHNRCIIPLKAENLTAWLHTAPRSPATAMDGGSAGNAGSSFPASALADYYTLLDNRERPYYAHELAA